MYKRVEESSYGSPELTYGIVIDLLNDGANCFIEAIEYKKSYSNVSASVVVFSGKKDSAIFPTSPDEVREYLNDAVDVMAKDIEEKKAELNRKMESLQKAKDFVSGETAKCLTGVSFETLPSGVPELNAISA